MIEFIDLFKAARASTLCELFYPSYRVAATRLKAVAEAGELQRERDGWCNEFIYYRKKPKQLRHSVLLTDFYRELSKIADVRKFKPEPTFDRVRPDAVTGFVHKGENRLALIEVSLSNNDDTKKYQSFDWRAHFPIQPEIILITDRPAIVNGYRVISVNTKLEGLKL